MLCWEIPDTNIPFRTAKSIVIKRFEKTYFSQALERNRGNVSRTAKQTGVNRRTIWRKIKECGLNGNRSETEDGM
jgi:transcriptional regulator of acetoin/glycerol metabolism